MLDRLGSVLVALGLGLILLLDRLGSSSIGLRLGLVLLLDRLGSALVALGHVVCLCHNGSCAAICGGDMCSLSFLPEAEGYESNNC